MNKFLLLNVSDRGAFVYSRENEHWHFYNDVVVHNYLSKKDSHGKSCAVVK